MAIEIPQNALSIKIFNNHYCFHWVVKSERVTYQFVSKALGLRSPQSGVRNAEAVT